MSGRFFLPTVLAGAAFGLALAGGLLLAPAPALAQNNPFDLRPPGAVPQPSRNYGGWHPAGPLDFLFPRQPEPQQAPPPPKKVAPPPPPEPEGVVYEDANAAVQGRKQPPTRFVLVLGDRLAEQLAQGLADNYVAERAAPAVIGAEEDPSGFLPAPVDWITRLPSVLPGARADVVVVALGSDDLEPIKDGDASVEPLTDRWQELYGKRVDEVLAAIRAQVGRVVLVGVAPVQNAATTADYERLNELLRARAARAGVAFANVWDGFVDEDGKYLTSGAAVDGQRRRLRQSDGIHFTRAGGRKLAFFVQKDLTRLLAEPAQSQPAPAADGTQSPSSLTDGPRPSNALLGASPPGIPAGAAFLPGATPTVSPAISSVSSSAAEAARALRDGAPVPTQRGRADDFAWPAAVPTPPAGATEPAAATPPAAP